ncbi:hypothetical protein KPATCC21470_7385 [Kitasatospora purpeofusca]
MSFGVEVGQAAVQPVGQSTVAAAQLVHQGPMYAVLARPSTA